MGCAAFAQVALPKRASYAWATTYVKMGDANLVLSVATIDAALQGTSPVLGGAPHRAAGGSVTAYFLDSSAVVKRCVP
jgi:hypothetical protein